MRRFGLSRHERISGRKLFAEIFEQGKTLNLASHKLRLLYYYVPVTDRAGVKIAAAISKKQGKAVWRNRMKRLIKEAYRLEKGSLVNFCIEQDITLLLVFFPSGINEKNLPHPALKDIQPSMNSLITVLPTIITP